MSDNWERITALFGAARGLDAPARAAFLDAACGRDTPLRLEVERLLDDASHDDAFLAESPWAGLTDIAAAPAPGDLVANRYRVESSLASGGQAVVYRATDTVLSRPVVLKVMRGSAQQNNLLKSRFEREMQALSLLDHPGVVGIHDVGALVDGSPYLVIQYINGISLREALNDGPLDRARIAWLLRELGPALSAAHAAGVAHRDLKPENIMIQRFGDGGEMLKLIDFGIAKVEREDLAAGVTNVTVAGTVRYMAPEQYQGEHSLASDIYALALVTCEMLSGHPDSRALPKQIDPKTRALIESALAFAPGERPKDVRLWCDQLAASMTSPRRRRRPAAWWTAAGAVATLVLGITAARTFWRPGNAAGADRVVVPLPDGWSLPNSPAVLSLSPDGRRLAFAAAPDHASSLRETQLWLRPLDSLVSAPLVAAGSAFQPFWSPDSRFIGFIDAGSSALKRIDPAGGPPVTIAERTYHGWDGMGRAAWSPRGVILFSGPDGRLYRVRDTGGTPLAVTTLNVTRRESAHFWPSFLPDGSHFVYLAYSSPTDCALYLGSLESPDRTEIADVVSTAEVANGYLLYQREGTLIAQRLDDHAGRLVGPAQPVAESIRFSRENGRAAFSASAAGVLAYATGGTNDVGSLTWHDRAGKALGTVGALEAYKYPRVSPDGTRVALNRRSGDGTWDTWVMDLRRPALNRVTFNGESDYWPMVWSPDSAAIVFSARRKEKPAYDLYRRAVGGGQSDELLFESADDKQATAVSPDGRLLLFNRQLNDAQGYDIWALPLQGPRKPFPVVSTRHTEESGAFSPDGRWIAYASNESGSDQIYVEPFPATGFKVQLSIEGSAAWPVWSADGQSIVYSTLNSTVWSVEVSTSGGVLRASAPQRLFTQHFIGSGFGAFGAAPSADRFLLIEPTDQEHDAKTIKLVLNWPALAGR